MKSWIDNEATVDVCIAALLHVLLWPVCVHTRVLLVVHCCCKVDTEGPNGSFEDSN